MFCLGTYGEFTEGGYFNEGCWVSNPYNAKNGGPCATPGRLLDQPARPASLYKQRLRYLIARWGYSPQRLRLGVLERGAADAAARRLGRRDGRLPEAARPEPAPREHDLRRRGDLEHAPTSTSP